jgi:predicted RNase H-like HicB family nuclease
MGKNVLHLTCLIRREGDQYSSLCLELDVASCGRTREEAFRGLKSAVEAYVMYLVEAGRDEEIFRPVPPEAIREFLLGEGEVEVEERKLTTVYAAPLEFTYAA